MQRELITLQIGNYANYVGAHYWNTQDELLGYAESEEWAPTAACIDADVLYALSEGRHGSVTYRPKVLMMDLSGSLGGVSVGTSSRQGAAGANGGDLGLGPTRVATWGGAVEVHRSAPVPKSAFIAELEEQADEWEDPQDAEAAAALQERQQSALQAAARQLDVQPAGGEGRAGVHFWTDFLKAELLHRSVLTLPGSWHGVADMTGWGAGRAALGREGQEDAMDRIRCFAENCDGLAGFQLFSEDVGGWGSVAADMVEELKQDYPGRQVLYFSVRPPAELNAGSVEHSATMASALLRSRSALNEALAVSSMLEAVDLYVPTAPPLRQGLLHGYLQGSAYHTSALLAAAMHGATLPYRLHPGASSPLGGPLGSLSLPAMTQLLTSRSGAKLASLRMLLPVPHLLLDTAQSSAEHDRRLVDQQAAGQVGQAGGTSPAKVLEDLRGLADLTPGVADESRACLAEVITLQGPRGPTGALATAAGLSALDALLLRQRRRHCVQHRCVTPLPLPLPLTFPRNMFAHSVSLHGDVRGPLAAGGANDVRTAPLLTKLVATSSFRGVLTHMQRSWREAAASGLGGSMLEAWGVERSEAEEVDEGLRRAAGAYREDGDLDSEDLSGDD